MGDDFDVFKLLVVDFMHEVELGVWKALFTHLICILYALDPSGVLVVTLNTRYVLESALFSHVYSHRYSHLSDSSRSLRLADLTFDVSGKKCQK